MSTTIEDIKTMYRDCDRCGYGLCTEDDWSVEHERQWYCSKEEKTK